MPTMPTQYDYLIVGSGLFGATFAYCAKQAGQRCLVIDKRPQLGGNVYCEQVEGIHVHKYGAQHAKRTAADEATTTGKRSRNKGTKEKIRRGLETRGVGKLGALVALEKNDKEIYENSINNRRYRARWLILE